MFLDLFLRLQTDQLFLTQFVFPYQNEAKDRTAVQVIF